MEKSANTSAVVKVLKAPKAFASGLLTPGVSPDKVWKAYKHHAVRSGDESLIMWPLKSLASMVMPKKRKIGPRVAMDPLDARAMKHKIHGLGWNTIGGKALVADVAVGTKLRKLPVVGKALFTLKEDIPWGPGMKKEIERASAVAPLIKVRDIAEPFLVGVGLEKGIKKLKELRHPQMGQDKHLREKAASVMLQLHEQNKEHEKRAHALRLLFKQAEMGLAQMPSSHSELETKLASLVNEDLVVLEKALELTGGTIKLGELDRNDPKAAMTPVEKFQASILGDEI